MIYAIFKFLNTNKKNVKIGLLFEIKPKCLKQKPYN